MKYAATIGDCEQYSPDDFRSVTRVKEIKPETTFQELIDWQKEMYPRNKQVQAGRIIAIQIVPMD